jgi:hypothetical protein
VAQIIKMQKVSARSIAYVSCQVSGIFCPYRALTTYTTCSCDSHCRQ